MQDKMHKRMIDRKDLQRKRKFVRIATAITALTLTCSLTSGQHEIKKINRLGFNVNSCGNWEMNTKKYKSYENIDDLYLLELYHTGLNRSVLYIAQRMKYDSGNSRYVNIINDYFIAYDNDEKDYYEFIKVIPLTDFFIQYDLEKDKYSYNDMLEIYNIIKRDYVFENINNIDLKNVNDTLIKKRKLI